MATALILHSSRKQRVRARTALDNHFELLEADHLCTANRHLARQQPPVVFAELALPQRKGLDILAAIRSASPASEVIVLSPVDTPSYAVASIKAGAFGFLGPSDGSDAILAAAYEALEHHEIEKMAASRAGGTSACRRMRTTLAGLDAARGNVVITGELGTGRKTLARSVHNAAAGHGVLRFVDCSRPPVLAQLGFTPDPCDDPGDATPSSLCLLNVERLTASDLRALEVVARHTVAVAVHPTLRLPVRYRLLCVGTAPSDEEQPAWLETLTSPPFSATRVEMPPLRHRAEELPSLCQQMLDRWSHEHALPPRRLADDALDALSTYAWPGNILELNNVIERLLLTSNSDVIDASMLPLEIHINTWRRGLTYRNAMEQLEREFLLRILGRVGGCRRRAAERLQLSYSTLKFRLRKLAITHDEKRLMPEI